MNCCIDIATGKSVVVHTPEEGLLPLTTDQSSQTASQDLSQVTAQPQQDMAQALMQPQADMPQANAQQIPQAAVQPQPDMSQFAMQPQQDMTQSAVQQNAVAPQMMAPNMANSTLYQGAPLQSNVQGFNQYQDPSQAGAYDSSQAASMDQSMQGQAAVNPYAGNLKNIIVDILYSFI